MKKVVFTSIALVIAHLGFSQLEFNTMGVAVTEDFNSYKADGFTNTPAPGQLHSQNWSIIGFSDGIMNFGDEKISGDFTGTSKVPTSTGGLNPFTDSFLPTDVNFGISTTASDMRDKGGDIILRIQNTSSFAISSIDLSYAFEYLDNEPRRTTFTFSYSTNNINFTPVPALNDTTPFGPATTAFWQSKPKSTTITGLNIPCGGYIYLKWNTIDAGGANGTDEIGLDDLSITPNGNVPSTCGPASNTAPTATNFSSAAIENILKTLVIIPTNASDLENDALKINIVTPPTNGVATVNGNNIDYTPTAAGTYTIVYNVEETATAPALKSTDKTITITVTAPGSGGSLPVLGDILITEFASEGTANQEWVEIYNASGSTFNLKDILITQLGTSGLSTKYALDSATGTGTIAPGEYVVITDDGADIAAITTRWPTFATAKAVVVTSFGLSNGTTGDEIILVNSSEAILDSLGWKNSTDLSAFTGGTLPVGATAETAQRTNLTGSGDVTTKWEKATTGTPGAANVPLANNPPTASDFNASVTINTLNSITVLPTNGSDVNSDALEVKIITPPTNGTAAVSGNNISYTPTVAGSYTIGFQVCETATADKFCSATKTISITATAGASSMFDDFNDGDFTNNPTWTGETTKMEVLANELHLNDVGTTGTAYLSAPSSDINNTTWQFTARVENTTSAGNLIDVYVTSDNANLDGNVNGYFVRIGDTEDEVSLWKREFIAGKDSVLKIIDGVDKTIDGVTTNVTIKVTRDASGNWELFRDLAGGTTFTSEGTVLDNNVTTSSFFGVKFKSTTSLARNTDKYIDEISISSTPVNTAPTNKNYTASAVENTLSTISVLGTANISDAQSDVLAITVVSTSNGTAVANGNNIDYTPTTAGTQTIVYRVCETATTDLFCSGDSIITVTVTATAPTNTVPTAANFSTTALENILKTIVVIPTNASDLDNDALKINIVTPPTNGVATVNGNNIDYTATIAGVYTIVYNVEETSTAPALKSADRTITVTVTASVSATIPGLGDILITEFASEGTANQEWVEIYNASGSTFNLKDILITQLGTSGLSTKYPLDSATGTGTIAPGEYIVITDDGADISAITTRWPSFATAKAVVVKSFGLSNGTTGDEIILVNSSDAILDSLGWKNSAELRAFSGGTLPSGSTAETTQRIDLTGLGDITTKWQKATAGSPGAANVLLTNTAPTNKNMAVNAVENVLKQIAVLGTTNVVDAESDVLSITVVSTTNGTAVANGSNINYTPTSAGSQTIIYKVCETATSDLFCSGDSTITVTVTSVALPNNAPTANNFTVTTPEVTKITLDVVSNTGDLDSDPLTTTIFKAPNTNKGTGVVVGKNIEYTPKTGFVGNDTLTYEVCDPSGDCAVGEVVITVTKVATTTCASITDSLYVHYKFDNNLNEELRGLSFSNAVGAPVFVNHVGVADAILFDGTNSIEAPGVSTNGFTELTISMWFKASPDNTQTFHNLTQGADLGFNVVIDAGKIYGFFDANSANSLRSTSIVTDDKWHYLVVQNNGSKTDLYLDGKFEATNIETLVTGATSSLFFGMSNQNKYGFKGAINDFRMYNKVLEQCQIDSLFNLQNSTNQSVNHGCGIRNKALNFNGSSDYVNLGNTVADNVRTIEFWFNPAEEVSNTSSSVPVQWDIIGRDDVATLTDLDDFSISLLSSANGVDAGKLIWAYRDGSKVHHSVKSDNNKWLANTWYHVAAVIDPVEGMLLVIDGVKQADVNATYKNPIAAKNWQTSIGQKGDVDRTDRYFKGKIDEVRFWTTARTEAEVSANKCDTTDISANTGLKALWNFNEGSGTTAGDSSSNSNNGAIVGATYSTEQICEYVCPVSSKLISCYPFIGNANDEQGTNNGTVNGATLTTDRFSKSNSAYSFNGVNNYIDLGNSFDIAEKSINLWFNTNSASVTDQIIYTIDNPSLVNGTYKMQLFDNSSKIRVIAGYLSTVIEAPITINTWNMVTISSGSDSTSYYLNGVFVAKMPAIAPVYKSVAGHPTTLIGTSRLFDRYFSGMIDDISIYDGPISQTKVSDLFNATGPVCGIATVNNPPTATNINTTVAQDGNKDVDVTTSINDLDGDPLTVSIIAQPTNGVAIITGNLITYTPAPGFSGNDTITYKVCDATDCASAKIYVSVEVVCTSNVLSGTVRFNTFGIPAKKVQLIKALGAGKFDLDNIVEVSTTTTGDFAFLGVNSGNYLLKAKDAGLYPASYKGKTAHWQLAEVVTVTAACANQPNLDIDIIEDFAIGKGKTQINGTIYSTNTAGGTPFKNVDVYVRLPSSNNLIVAHTTTADDGTYNFANVIDGNQQYKIFVDVAGYKSKQVDLIVKPNRTEIPKADFCTNSADSLNTCTGLALAVDELEKELANVKVYPNPTTNSLFVDYTLTETSDVTITIYGMLGESIYSTAATNVLSGVNTVDLSNQITAAGIYNVIVTINGHNFPVKVVKME